MNLKTFELGAVPAVHNLLCDGYPVLWRDLNTERVHGSRESATDHLKT